MRLLQKSLRFRNKLISFDRTVSSKVRKKLLKNEVKLRWSVWPQWIHGLCRLWKQTSPQRIPCGLHQQRCTRYIAWIYEMCCELVHSFSITHKGMTALTIFPYSSAVKAACAAISDRLGRTINRFIMVRTAPENSVSLHFVGYPC